MKHRSLREALPALAVVFFMLFSTGVVYADTDEAAIDKARLAFNAAYNAGDAKAMGKLIDQDAVWMPPTGEQAVVGADKVVARYTSFFKKTRSAFELQPGTVQLSGQWAFLNGTWHREDSSKKGGKSMKHGGHYLMVFKKQADGGWKIARDIWNDARKP